MVLITPVSEFPLEILKNILIRHKRYFRNKLNEGPHVHEGTELFYLILSYSNLILKTSIEISKCTVSNQAII